MSDAPSYRYHLDRAQTEAVRAIQSLSPVVAAVHQELSLRHSGRALSGLFEAVADRLRERRSA